jgi:hypothetical protein
MKKGVKTTLIVVPLILVLIASSFGGTLLYSKNNVSYDLGNPNAISLIIEVPLYEPPWIDYSGLINVHVPLDINNNGLYNIRDLTISVEIYGQNFSLSSLNDELLVQGTNEIGDVKHGSTWSGDLQFNITSSIPYLAVLSGELRIEIDILLKIDFILFDAPIHFNETQVELWDAPFFF